MKTYLQNWNIMRIIRLSLALIIIVQGFIVKDWTFFLMGGLLALMALMNIGCCGVSGCTVPRTNSSEFKNETITYEEVDAKK